MEPILQRHASKNHIASFDGGDSERSFRVVSSGKYKETFNGLDVQMKLFLMTVFVGVISFGMISGAALHLTYDAKTEEVYMPVTVARLITLSLKQLSEQNI